MNISEEKRKILTQLNTHDKETLKLFLVRLEQLTKKTEFNEQFLLDFKRLRMEIDLLEEQYTTRYINLLKSNIEV